jgi:hypothetical protein
MIFALRTVDFQSEPGDYWDDVWSERTEVAGHEHQWWLAEFDSIEDCWDACDNVNVIVSETGIYTEEHEPDKIDVFVEVYDGYNE